MQMTEPGGALHQGRSIDDGSVTEAAAEIYIAATQFTQNQLGMDDDGTAACLMRATVVAALCANKHGPDRQLPYALLREKLMAQFGAELDAIPRFISDHPKMFPAVN